MRYLIVILCAMLLTACPDDGRSSKNAQAEKAKAAANSIQFTENAEIDNIKKRLELTANPGLLGFVVLLNETGQPVMYTGVNGKITSGGKRLTRPDRVTTEGPGANNVVAQAPSDEGTFGHNGEYVFFWTPANQYIQWNGKYLYSDKPFRLSVEPLVITAAK